MQINHQRLLDRFLRYVAVESTSDDATDTYPSSSGQLELGRLLVDELLQMGVDDAQQNKYGLVLATLPATVPEPVPTIAWNSHLDTSPETTARDVKPQVIRDYQGGDIRLPAGANLSLRVEDNPELKELHGCTLITTDGTTLLGADDKAGVAIIMEAVHTLRENPHLPHGPIRILFTCDEEIGRGVDHVDIEQLGATACYTVDGPGAGQIDVETFSADLARVVIRGVNIHPAIAKDRMVNALRAAAEFLTRMPRDTMSPETTTDRQGFLHPYQIEGGVGEVVLRVLLRDFVTSQLQQQADLLRQIAHDVTQIIPGSRISIDVTQQYRNLGDGLAREPRAADYAEEAFRRLHRPVRRTIIRGGTDGSRLTELGLPTPNLSSGQHNPHSVLEWACLDEMVQAVEVLLELAHVWTSPPK